MKISGQNTSKQIVSPGKNTSKKQNIDLDAISVLMDNDAVSISNEKIDPHTPAKHWRFQLSEPTVDGLLKGSGTGSKSSGVEFSILHTNDEHDPKFNKSFPKETTLLRQREKFHGDENSFLVNTGDLTYEGSNDKPGPQFFGPTAEILNSQGIEFLVPGNHEFQHGGRYLEEEFLPKLDATVLLGNVKFKDTGKPLENTKPYTIEKVNGVNVGIIGLSTPRQATSAHPHVGYDINTTSIQQGAAKLVPEVKKAGAEVVVIIAHEGVNRCVDAASSVPGIDVIVAGHDHQKLHDPKEIKNPDGRTTLVIEAGSHGKYVGDLTLEVDRGSKKVVSVDYKLFETANVEQDREVMEIVNKYYGK